MTDYYEVLGVTREATLAEIKKTHRGLIKSYHPDTSGGPAMLKRSSADIASDEFLLIQRAYETLSDPESRAMYDKYGFAQADKQFEEVKKLAIGLATHILERGVNPGLFINEMELTLVEALEQHSVNMHLADSNIEKLEAQRRTIRLKDEKSLDMIGIAMDQLIESHTTTKFQLQETIDNHKALLKFVRTYESIP